MKVTIDGIEVEVESGTTILEAATMADRYVPTLCFDDRMDPFGACRVCMVGVEDAPNPLAACTTPCKDGMVVNTEDETSRRIAGATVELVMSELPDAPEEHTELADVARHFGIGEPRWQGEQRRPNHDGRHPYLVHPARAVHLLRPLRARLRRDPGRLRAHRHRTRLRVGNHRRSRLRLHRLHLRFVRRVRGYLPHRRHNRASTAGTGATF